MPRRQSSIRNWGNLNNYGNFGNFGNFGNYNGRLSLSLNPVKDQAPSQSVPQNAAVADSKKDNSKCAGDWAQCGGSKYNGPTCCQRGKCQKINNFYSQCKPYL